MIREFGMNSYSEINYDYLAYILDESYERLKHVYLESSVLGPARFYSALDNVDKEFWALFCSLIDFQMPVMKILNPMLFGLASSIEEYDLKFIYLIQDEALARKVFSNFQWTCSRGLRVGFTHRFVKVDDIIMLFKIFRKIIDEYNSLGSFVRTAYEGSMYNEEPMEGVLSSLIKLFSEYGGRPPLIPTKFSSTLKRLNLFMRWMVRPYPDLGLWSFIDKKHLLISLDVGLQRVLSRAFSLRVGLNWHGVLKTTRFLRKINLSDPAKYDYPLSRISIMGYCAKELSKSRCYLCPLINICKVSRFTPIPKAKALKGKERKIFESFLKIYGHEFDDVRTEYPLGRYSADALLHKTSCETYVTEVENELNYNAIGQVLTYCFLYFKIRGKTAKPMIICSRSTGDLKDACKTEQGIEVIEMGGME